MARDKNGNLYIYDQKPSKYQKYGYWTSYSCIEKPMYMFDSNIFKSITWEDDEPTLIIDIYNPQILDDVEREYLKTVLKPFHKKVRYVVKFVDSPLCEDIYSKERLFIALCGGHFNFPRFVSGKMYSGMELDKEYKLDELGITYDD